MRSCILRAFVGCLLTLLLPISFGNAASVRQVDMDKMIQECRLVFEGRVTAVEARENSQKRIHTYVTFAIEEVIKGDYAEKSITLRFLGGTVGDVTMSVSDMQWPQMGEHGIYFVESLKRPQVHPFYGWSQGHFIVEPDAQGRGRVMTSGRQPVMEVLDDVPAEQKSSAGSQLSHGNGVARGLAVAREKKDNVGLTTDEFKMNLYEKLWRKQ